MRKWREKFTKWYVCKGYTFGYDENLCAVWNCPWYIKPLLFLFSPSIYDIEKITKTFVNGFLKGLNESIEKEFRIITEEDGE